MPPSYPLPDNGKPLLLCFSHLRWNFVYQRPQHLISRATTDYQVVYFEEPVFERDVQATLRLTPSKSGVLVAVPVLPETVDRTLVEAVLRRLVDQLLASFRTRTILLWYYTPMALGFSDHIRADAYVYDCMDELSAFRGAPPELCSRERELFAKADFVFCGGASLYEAKRHHHHSVHAFPSSVDRAHFATAKSWRGQDAEDQAQIPHPRVGFFGVIDERLDLGMVEQLADARPDVHFVLVGPIVKIDEASVPRRANIHALGSKQYDELPRYLGGWDAGYMPFALNESTRFISPTKTPEFLSAGLPLISTPVADVVRPYGVEGLVRIASSVEEMSLAIDECLASQGDQWRAKVDRKLAGMSWDKTWAAMNHIIATRLRAARPPAEVYASEGKASSYV